MGRNRSTVAGRWIDLHQALSRCEPHQGHLLGPVDAFWHLLNFFAPAGGVGLIATALAKLLWRRELARVGWARLSAWCGAGCAVVLVAGLVVFGHDGKFATYTAMVAICALTLWWVGFGPRRR